MKPKKSKKTKSIEALEDKGAIAAIREIDET